MPVRETVAVLLLSGAAAGCSLSEPELGRIGEAFVTVRTDDGIQLPRQRVTLRHRWDAQFPGRDGTAVYEIELPRSTHEAPRAALIERSGNQLEVQLDGGAPVRLGRSRASDATKAAHLIDLPPQAARMQVTVHAQALRGAGLNAVLVGAREAVEARLAYRRLIDQVLPALYATSLLLMGGLAAGLWWRQRDALYGCFSLAALFGSVRNIDRLIADAPLPWALWGALLAIAYGWHLTLNARFGVLVTGREPGWMPLAARVTLAAVSALAVASFALGVPGLWTGALVALEMFGALAFMIVIRDAAARRRPSVLFVLAAGLLLLGAGLHDLLAVRTSVVDVPREPLATHALFLFVLLMAGVVVARYNRSVAAVQAANRELTQRVAEREAQLTQAFEAIRLQREQQAAAAERQRIMRDIHDGVGSQLVGLRSLVRQAHPDASQLVQHVEGALDELRMAVDSMQPTDGDLATVLATLRYRLQPRLSAAGVNVVWAVEPLPGLTHLSPNAVLQLQRILLEGFTNVIRHARASSVVVRARYVESDASGPSVCIELEDDGVGMAAGLESPGHGLSNIRARAEAIGAQVTLTSPPAGGTRLALRWPMPAPDGLTPSSTAGPAPSQA